MPDEPSSDRKSGFLAFWTTLPGILTGLAALITAIVGAVGLWKTQSGGDSTPTSPGEPVTATSTAETGRQGSGSGVLAKGRLSLVSGDWADLERGQVGSAVAGDVTFGPETTPTLHAAGAASLAPVDARPTKRSCVSALTARSDSFELVSRVETKWICVSTTEKNVAAVRILSSPGPGNAKLVLGYTVWP